MILTGIAIPHRPTNQNNSCQAGLGNSDWTQRSFSQQGLLNPNSEALYAKEIQNN